MSICVVCGKVIVNSGDFGAPAKYCSGECRLDHRRKSRTRYDAVCVQCGKGFQSFHKHGKFCSAHCRGAMLTADAEKRVGEICRTGKKQCLGCGELIDLGQFLRSSRTPDGFGKHCRQCRDILWLKRSQRTRTVDM